MTSSLLRRSTRSHSSRREPPRRDAAPCRRPGGAQRFNLFPRWTARSRDGIDLGLWRGLDPSRLMVPLDTHIAFLGRAPGLTKRRTAGWMMAEEIPAALRTLDVRDPVKYDWSLTRLGDLGDCPSRRDPRTCPACPVHPRCRL
ncbi:MAG: hypothetical protein CMJ83_05780 [Planctomycetes bacterium]|nr:hypothetical protein [Planctomycetota bacterium]